jgi:hypothetical protein
VITVRYANGSLGTMTYLANGNKSFSKERVEVFCAGKIGILDDFRSLELVSETKRKIFRSIMKQDKGHQASWQNFIKVITNGQTPPIPYDQLMAVHKACFAAMKALTSGEEVKL